MIASIGGSKPTYSMSDLYKVAMQEMKREMESMKKAPLTHKEEARIEQLAKAVAHDTIKEMGIV